MFINHRTYTCEKIAMNNSNVKLTLIAMAKNVLMSTRSY